MPALSLGDSWPLCVAADSQPGTNVCWAGTGWSGLREAALPLLKSCFPRGQHNSAAVSSQPLGGSRAAAGVPPEILDGHQSSWWKNTLADTGLCCNCTCRWQPGKAEIPKETLRVQVTVVSFGSPCALWEEGVGWCRARETAVRHAMPDPPGSPPLLSSARRSPATFRSSETTTSCCCSS